MSRRPRSSVRLAALAAVTIGVLVGPAASLATAAPAAPKSPGTVEVKAFRFRPATLEVAPGTKVVWRNRDQIEHTVTSAEGAPAELDGTLSRAGAKYAVRLTAPGTYQYFCARHPSMKGTVIVG